ncbi:Ferredoxin subunit of nitrite reductase or a ring-hydroxylating dioxygenase [Lentzea xinjiangensis]|uniref:Ferredoxin subunit of nitrite reductase or a ring-hydroxylating dioxygenase n=1 Tax=Lentzea xinjiangensis TaxID=402600 RepID=A0A1H9U569_9PSEU|nr:Ferredoxin subunit of nitrite reductase or a ring-hydroxylating dioxygenase [Lentzea xinjiangensis]
MLLCGLAAVVSACGEPAPRKTGGTGTARPGDRVTAASAVPVNGGVLVDLPGNAQLLVVQPRPGEFRAFNPSCPHVGSLVNPPAGGVITCPLHGSTFDPASGAVRKGPAASGLAEVAITLSGEDLVLA